MEPARKEAVYIGDRVEGDRDCCCLGCGVNDWGGGEGIRVKVIGVAVV